MPAEVSVIFLEIVPIPPEVAPKETMKLITDSRLKHVPDPSLGMKQHLSVLLVDVAFFFKLLSFRFSHHTKTGGFQVHGVTTNTNLLQNLLNYIDKVI